ncbi:SUMF1/EgtB/PvdO family nonheme iron enzyme [Candidatus Parcubacteria bacterium]|nr:SUMF1/EgtB/PvdO family nonheme iron enzyme [Candidatus Parcubacteria bacterium]
MAKFIGKKEIIVMISAVILTTAGIKASDSFFNSADKAITPDGKCPVYMVHVVSASGDFCIDQYEASPGDDCSYQNPGGQNETRINLDFGKCQPVSKPNRVPWRYISQDQAVLACAKAGKRLPTNEEWFAAALGTPDKINSWTNDDCQVNNNWEEQPGAGGSGINCRSAAGAFDMVGNVWEWVSGAVNNGKFEGQELPEAGFIDSTGGNSLPALTNKQSPNENYYYDYFFIKHNGVRGMARGGYWDNKSDAGQYSVYVVSPPSGVGQGTGFRCVK